MIRTASTVAALFALVMSTAVAHDYTVGSLKVDHPWARATPKGAGVGGGYMKITNTGTESDRLVGGASGISDRFEVHEMSMADGVMKMRHLAGGLEIKPGQTVEFKPGGYHAMFMGLKQQLVQGQRFKVTLQFERAGKIDIDFVIEGIGAQTGGDTGNHGGAHMKH